MIITLNLFAGLRDAAGATSLQVEVSSGSTAAMAFTRAYQLHPDLHEWAATVAFARNGKILPRDTALTEGDQLDVLPPVSGG